MKNEEAVRSSSEARILIVEDEAIEALDLQMRLVKLGYPTPDIVHNGEDAIKKSRDTRPDLVLMDIMLSGQVDGVTAAEQIRTFLDAPIIYVTAYSDETTLRRAKITEPYGYIVKPYQERELQSAIEVALYKHAAEKKLEELRKQTADLFDFAPVGYFILDSRGIVSNTNFTSSHMLGTSREKMLNVPFTNFVEPQYHGTFRAYLENIAQTGQLSSTEMELRKSDGSKFYAQLQSVIIYEKSRAVYRISIADITDRKRAEIALTISDQKCRELTDSFPEMIFETDLTGAVTYANRKAIESYGLTPEDFHGRINILDYVSAETRNIAAERFRRVLTAGDIGTDEYMVRRKDGTLFPALAHVSILMRDGKPAGTRGILVDITVRKHAEELLEASQKRMRSILDSIQEGCLIFDFDWRCVYANEATGQQGRFTKKQWIGHTAAELLPGFEKTETYARQKEVMEKRVPQEMETQHVYPDGVRRWFQITIKPVEEGILVLYLNITDQKATIERLK